MMASCQEQFEHCDGMIGTAAPCDYRPVKVADQKIKKDGNPLILHMIETSDVVATLGNDKRPDQWVVGFALETEDAHFRAVTKLHKKCCDLVVVNGPQAINSTTNMVDILIPSGQVIATFGGPKTSVARAIFIEIQKRLIETSIAVSQIDE